MPKVSIRAIGGPYDGRAFELEAPRPFIPDSSLDEPGWFTPDLEPKVSGAGYCQVESPTTMVWHQDPRTP